MSPFMYNDSSSSPSGASTPPSAVIDAVGAREPEPIAIVGMGCRLPGGVKSPQDLWELLMAGRSGQGDVPPSRWNIDGFYHPNAQRPGSMNTRGGYFVDEDIRQFDNSFFGINNLEATYMDPMQRKLLEVCYECFESAGAPQETLSGANVGVYVGNFTVDYIIMQAKEAEYAHRYGATGSGTTILSNRISHVFNLTGPSVVLDTACSSSLYALHMACAALDAGECDAALAAGVNLVQSPEQHIGTMRAGVLSGTSTCHTFDASADGYGRADGVGAVYLKKLSSALRDNDPIHGIVRGTAINANGRTNGITLPSAEGQEAVIRKAYAKAGLAYRYNETDYVECHGTGTAVGDPIELQGLASVFSKRLAAGQAPLLVGSVKTNLGHSEAASGFSSIFKVAMALQHKTIPPTIGVKNINPKIKSDEWGIKIVTEAAEWPAPSLGALGGRAVRRAGVNSFGYGGANSHAILEAVETFVPPRQGPSSQALSKMRSTFVLPVSANSEASLNGQLSNLATLDVDQLNVVDLAYTLGSRRSKLSHRAFTLAGQNTLDESLLQESFVRATAPADSSRCLPLCFVFTGQGAQWAEMGKELIQEVPSFRRSLVELDNALQRLPSGHAPSWTLRQALLDPKETSMINHVTRSQPVCTAVQIALVQMLWRWGIEPAAVVGHSSGEIGAAYAAGLLTAEEAIVVAYYRGYVVGHRQLPSKGGMMAAGLGPEQAQQEIDQLNLGGSIVVACINSPESVTISGDADGIETMVAHLQTKGLFARKLNTNNRAYHSHHMQLLGQEYQDLLEENLPPKPFFTPDRTGKAKWISSVTGEEVTAAKIKPSYWRSNLESPVRFSDAVEGVIGMSKHTFVELGPHSALELPIKQTMASMNKKAGSDWHYLSALRRHQNAVTCAMTLAGNLFLHGHPIDFGQVNYVEAVATTGLAKYAARHPAHQQGSVVASLRPYAWTYDGLLWSEGRASTEFRNRKHLHHDLLGAQRPGGNGSTTTWRNVLRAHDVSWLLDHRLDDTVVFPGAGYMAMAIEAVCQVSGRKVTDSGLAVTLRQFHILKALPLPADQNAQGVELFTSLKPMALSAATDSKAWFEFEVTSFRDGLATTHATGKVTVAGGKEKAAAKKPDLVPADADCEALAMRTWYGQFLKVGLNYGPNFAALSEMRTPRSKTGMHAIGRTPLRRGGGQGVETESNYLVHPTTVDVILQAGLIAASQGVVKNLAAQVPVAFDEAIFQAPVQQQNEEEYTIDAKADRIGFSALLLNASLHDANNHPVVVLKDLRATGYQGGAQVDDDEEQREPMLRLLWKPDVTALTSTGLSKYLATSQGEETQDQIASVVDLFSHKNPRLRVLDATESDDLTAHLVEGLRLRSPLKRCATYTQGRWTAEGLVLKAFGDEKEVSATGKGEYDLVIVSEQLANNGEACARLTEVVASAGGMLKVTSGSCKPTDGFTSIDTPAKGGKKLEVSIRSEGQHETATSDILLVEESAEDAFNDVLAKHLASTYGQNVRRLLLSQLASDSVTADTLVVSTIELRRAVMSTLTDSEMVSIKHITNNAHRLLWVTGGDNMDGTRPDFALMSGLSRALMLEQPSLAITMMDLDDATPTSDTLSLITAVLRQAAEATVPDFEFAMKRGLLHISRMVPDEEMNATFRARQGEVATLTPLSEAKPARMTIGTVGQFDTLAFVRQPTDVDALQPGEIEVEVKSIGLNAKDFYVLAGKVNTKDGICKLECAGVVTRVASEGVSRLAVGDRVVAMRPGHFLTRERFPEWACQKLRPDEDYHVASTLPLVFSTALYGLNHRARLQRGESVLIHSAAGGLGNAAIQVAQLVGAEPIFATVSTEEKKDFLVETFGLKREHIFNSRDASFLPAVLEATGGRGVDVVLNSLTGDLLHASWRACAPFGRFVEVGKQDIVDAGKLDMNVFRRCATFTAFDLGELWAEGEPELNQMVSSLLEETMSLWRQNKIKAIEPLRVFDVSEITQAYRYFGLGNRLGKIAISLEKDDSLIPTLPLKYSSSFSADKSYLMIGCLGGLGGSISKWMLKRGARKFVFVGRSGTDRKPARQLVESLQAAGAEVTVVRGDVGVYADVQKAVAAIQGPVGGVIQAAMGLHEALWTSMPNEWWHTGIDPKLVGSWNLYHALEGRTSDLDFFLMTSSISGSVGTATEGNYCAANYFLDVFARFLRSRGLPGLAIGLGMISEVGYLHENPEIEALLLRKGIQAINEDELLQIVDLSVANLQRPASAVYDLNAASHVLTGLEPLGMKLLRKKGFSGTNPTMNDPRAAVLAAVLDSDADKSLKDSSGMPEELAAALEGGVEGRSVLEVIIQLIIERFSNLVLQQADRIDPAKGLSKFGMDSMLAAEFRTWFYQAFKVDVPFLTLLAETTTLTTLGELVHDSVVAAK